MTISANNPNVIAPSPEVIVAREDLRFLRGATENLRLIHDRLPAGSGRDLHVDQAVQQSLSGIEAARQAGRPVEGLSLLFAAEALGASVHATPGQQIAADELAKSGLLDADQQGVLSKLANDRWNMISSSIPREEIAPVIHGQVTRAMDNETQRKYEEGVAFATFYELALMAFDTGATFDRPDLRTGEQFLARVAGIVPEAS